tara:strand:+ start:956 stop:1147 length:192 start_codon:yes stop_codon:yes gene_type:complete
MKVGDLVVSKAYQNYSNIVPAKLVVQTTLGKGGKLRGSAEYIVTADEPDNWKPANSFFVVSPA